MAWSEIKLDEKLERGNLEMLQTIHRFKRLKEKILKNLD